MYFCQVTYMMKSFASHLIFPLFSLLLIWNRRGRVMTTYKKLRKSLDKQKSSLFVFFNEWFHDRSLMQFLIGVINTYFPFALTQK